MEGVGSWVHRDRFRKMRVGEILSRKKTSFINLERRLAMRKFLLDISLEDSAEGKGGVQ